jgi:hypothetical protein
VAPFGDNRCGHCDPVRRGVIYDDQPKALAAAKAKQEEVP